jgi:hypothetical protein
MCKTLSLFVTQCKNCSDILFQSTLDNHSHLTHIHPIAFWNLLFFTCGVITLQKFDSRQGTQNFDFTKRYRTYKKLTMFKSLDSDNSDKKKPKKKPNKNKKRRGTLLATKDQPDQYLIRIKVFKTKELTLRVNDETLLGIQLSIESDKSDSECTQKQTPDETKVFEWNQVFDMEIDDLENSVLTVDMVDQSDEIVGKGVIYFNKLDIKQEATALFWLGIYENVTENPKRIGRVLMELKPVNFSLSANERLLQTLNKKQQL